jgi:phage shock protein PspC (stress-responsive transcriptional regulator)
MRRVETISINGTVFSINGDAYRTLNEYLDALNKYFEYEEGGNEVITDIEARIAELLAERTGGVSRVITGSDVSHIIETLGRLEDITDSESDGDNRPYSGRRKYARRLYRNIDRHILGGVCAGIASWLGISVLVVRLIFFACFWFYGISALAYFLLWIIVPPAKTTAQKLEMQGQPINISNIERSIKENLSSSGLQQSFDRFNDEAGEVAGKFLKIILAFLRVISGTVLCISGIFIALLCFGFAIYQDFIFMHETEWDFLTFGELLQHMISPVSYNILVTCAIVIAVLTVLACLYWGIKIIAHSRVKHVKWHITLLIIWLLTIPTVIITFAYEAGNYKHYNKTYESVTITASDTLYLDMPAPELKLSNNFRIYYDREEGHFYGKPDIFIRKSIDGNVKMEIIKDARNRNKHVAFDNAENIEYGFGVRDSLITFSPYFSVDPPEVWKFQHVDVVLYVPENTVIIFSKSLCHADIVRLWSRRGYSCKWIMKKDGLKAMN